MGSRENNQENLINLLKHKGLTQKDLADACGVKAAAVSKWIKGTQIPNVELYDKICDFFEISLDQLFGREPLNF